MAQEKRCRMVLCWAVAAGVFAVVAQAADSPPYSFDDAQAVVKTYCQTCHQGKSAPGHLDLTRYSTSETLAKEPQVWSRVFQRVHDGSMPPKGTPGPSVVEREKLAGWLETTLRTTVCASGPTPGPAPVRRLNRSQYSNTIRHLLNIQFHAGHSLPEDGAGGEGFDNSAETLFLSPTLAEKYLEAAKEELRVAFQNPTTREAILIARPGPQTTPEQAARKSLAAFLPRAYRRPAQADEVESYLALFRTAQKKGESFEKAMLFTLEGVLISPQFLFRVEEPNPDPQSRLLGDYELASRLSYFLWNSMPDQELFDLASQGKLNNPETLQKQVLRMMAPDIKGVDDDVKITKENKLDASVGQFVEQWLGTRELGRDIKPDAKLFPQYYETELESAIHYEPIVFFKELLVSNLSLINLIDSKFAMLNNPLQKLYGLNLKAQARVSAVGAQLGHVQLPDDSHRGGLLGMAAVLAVSSYPNRTSPVLRGKWVLESLLGTPPPPPPPSVPALEEAHAGAAPKTIRERLDQHRRDPACAGCHSRIDPLGFGLENYDVIGRWRTTDSGAPVDTKGELPDGTKFDGPLELKAVLLSRKDVFIRNLTSKMLGYALGRGLRLEDSCAVDQIVAKLKENDYSAQTLVQEIVLSVPFRYQAAANSTVSLNQGGAQ